MVKAYYGYLTARDSRLLLEDTQRRLQGALNLVDASGSTRARAMPSSPTSTRWSPVSA